MFIFETSKAVDLSSKGNSVVVNINTFIVFSQRTSNKSDPSDSCHAEYYFWWNEISQCLCSIHCPVSVPNLEYRSCLKCVAPVEKYTPFCRCECANCQRNRGKIEWFSIFVPSLISSLHYGPLTGVKWIFFREMFSIYRLT